MIFHFNFELGKLTDWIQAIANSLILLLGIVTLIDQKKQIKDIKDKEEERQQIEESAQANLVSAWAESWDVHKINGCCLNLSNEPIYEVVVSYEGIKKEIFLMKPKEEQNFELESTVLGTEVPMLSINFRDGSGRMWCRDTNGKICSVTLS